MSRLGEDITFAQLRTFVCAANAGSFVKAADRLGISQPAVSEQITTLERRLGHELFRRRRGTTPLLTPRGEATLKTVETILAASDDLFAGDAPVTRRKTVVRICIGPLLRDHYLRPLLPAICRAYPDVEIQFPSPVPLLEGISSLGEGDLDLIVYSVLSVPEGVPFVKKVCDVPVAVVARPGTQGMLDRGECTLADLDFLFPSQRTPYAEKWLGALLRDLGVRMERSAKFIDCGDALPDLVEDGQGVAYLMIETVADRVAAGRLEVLDLPLPPMHRIIAQSPNASPVVSSISAALREALRTIPSDLRPGRITRAAAQ